MIRSGLIYLFLAYSAQLLAVGQSVAFIKHMPLEALGAITIAKVYSQFADFSHLGTRYAMDRFLPTSNADERARLLTVSLFVTGTASLALLLASTFISEADSVVMTFVVSGICLAVAALLKSYHRALADFDRVNRIVLYTTVLPLAIQLVAIALFSFEVFLWVLAVSHLAPIAWTLWLHRNRLTWDYPAAVRHAFAMSRPSVVLFFNGLLAFVSLSLDRLFLDQHVDRATLGQFAIVTFWIAIAMLVPSTLGEMTMPRIMRKDRPIHYRACTKEQLLILLPTVVVIGIAYLVTPPVLALLSPQPHLVPTLQLAVLGVLPMCFVVVANQILVARDAHRQLLGVTAGTLVAYACALYVSIPSSSDPLRTAVWVRIAYSALFAAALLFCVVRGRSAPVALRSQVT